MRAFLTVALIAATGSARASSGLDMLEGCQIVARPWASISTVPPEATLVRTRECIATISALLRSGETCPPKGAIETDAAQIGLAFVRTHRDRAWEDYRTLFRDALREAWPCH